MANQNSITTLGEVLWSHPAVAEIVGFLKAEGLDFAEVKIVTQDASLILVDVRQTYRKRKGETG